MGVNVGNGHCEDVSGGIKFMEVVVAFLHHICALHLFSQFTTCGNCVLWALFFQLAIWFRALASRLRIPIVHACRCVLHACTCPRAHHVCVIHACASCLALLVHVATCLVIFAFLAHVSLLMLPNVAFMAPSNRNHVTSAPSPGILTPIIAAWWSMHLCFLALLGFALLVLHDFCIYIQTTFKQRVLMIIPMGELLTVAMVSIVPNKTSASVGDSSSSSLRPYTTSCDFVDVGINRFQNTVVRLRVEVAITLMAFPNN